MTAKRRSSPFESDDARFASDRPTLAGGDAGQDTTQGPTIPEQIGQYRILRKLGEGGMGLVFEAEQQNPRRRVAFKVIRGGQFIDEGRLQMFRREADTLARLQHPDIAAIYESGRTEDGQHFFAMELVQGETLDVYLQRRPKVITAQELRVRLRLFCKIADAVHYAHQRGVIHRDLKPANIVVSEALPGEDGSRSDGQLPRIKILDFGLARITEGDLAATSMMTEVGTIKGTLPYMSPEQAMGDPAAIDIRTDVYALGVILYEMLAGRRPYEMQSISLVEAVRVICEQPPRPLQQVWLGDHPLDADVATIVAKALAKSADERYGSAAALSEDLERYLTSQPILARPASAFYLLEKFVARNKLATSFAATVLLLLIGFGVWMSLLYVRALRAESAAVAARDRSEASKLLALGRLELDEGPSSALAYALASLELEDDAESRRFVLETLWQGPAAFDVAPLTRSWRFSPDGRWLTLTPYPGAAVVGERGHFVPGPGLEHVLLASVGVSMDSSLFFAKSRFEERLRTWTLPDGRPGADLGLGPHSQFLQASRSGETFVFAADSAGRFVEVRAWSPGSDDRLRALGRIHSPALADVLLTSGEVAAVVDADGRRVFYSAGRDPAEATEIVWLPLDALGTARPRLAGRLPRPLLRSPDAPVFFPVALHPGDDLLAAVDVERWVHVMVAKDPAARPLRRLHHPGAVAVAFHPEEALLATGGGDRTVRVWDLRGPPAAEPLVLRRRNQQQVMGVGFHPGGNWLVTASNGEGAIWPLTRDYARVLAGHEGPLNDLEFTAEWLISAARDLRPPRVWALAASTRLPGGTLRTPMLTVAMDPAGEFLLGGSWGDVVIEHVASGAVTELSGFTDQVWSVSFDGIGRRAAASGGQFDSKEAVARVWDLDSGQVQILDPGDGKWISQVLFLRDGRLLTVGPGGIRRWVLGAGTFEVLSPEPASSVTLTSDERTMVSLGPGGSLNQGDSVRVHDLASGRTWTLASHGDRVLSVALDASGTRVITGDVDGVVRVGPLTGEEPHWLLGHQGPARVVAAHPTDEWIASGGADGTVRLWRYPVGTPLHTLPREDLLERLRRLTNYRVVADPAATAGYRLEYSPFPGWAEMPVW